jgi:hypothetical protein
MTPRSLGFWLALAAVGAVVLGSCGGDDGGPRPVRGVTLDHHSASVEIYQTLGLTATVSGGETKGVKWFVNGLEGGSADVGVVTQVNPATYTAPGAIPAVAVFIKAVSEEDTTESDSCEVEVVFNTIYVNAAEGNDETGDGAIAKPVKSITHGLALADSGKTVLVAPGIYDNANGEVFPLHVPKAVALVGENWETTIIRGHTQETSSGEGVGLYEDGAVFRKFKIEDMADADHRWFQTIYVTGAGVTVDSIQCHTRCGFVMARIDATDDVVIQNCDFGVEGDTLRTRRGIEVVFNCTGAIVRNCKVSGYGLGMFFNRQADPLVEQCTVEHNINGIDLYYEDIYPEMHPDLGGGARGSLGGNIIRDNSGCGVRNATPYAIYAKFNTWDNPLPGTDVCNGGGGSVVTE